MLVPLMVSKKYVFTMSCLNIFPVSPGFIDCGNRGMFMIIEFDLISNIDKDRGNFIRIAQIKPNKI